MSCLRGLHAADRERIETLAGAAPEHLYDGLLASCCGSSFLLYAEDRDLIPSRTDAEARTFYAQAMACARSNAQLLADRAHHPDTMDERRGAWGGCSRCSHCCIMATAGETGSAAAAAGCSIDPTAFPFLQGQEQGRDEPAPAPVSDGCILRILDSPDHGRRREALLPHARR